MHYSDFFIVGALKEQFFPMVKLLKHGLFTLLLQQNPLFVNLFQTLVISIAISLKWRESVVRMQAKCLPCIYLIDK